MTNGKRAIRRAYDDIADEYLTRRSDEPSAARLLCDLGDRLSDDARVLDAGCGAGVPVATRLAAAYDVVGVDFSVEQVQRARANVPRAAFAQGDMTTLAFADDSFDAVCAFFSLIHVPMDEHPRAVREFHRVLRPGGVALLTVGGDEWTGSNPDWLDTGVEMHWSFPDTETSVRHLREVGFDVLQRWTVEDELGGAFPFLLAENVDSSPLG
jgi:SAM-dependent methyltransferase